jgi:hypoxanthine phosphoribosyltransferase
MNKNYKLKLFIDNKKIQKLCKKLAKQIDKDFSKYIKDNSNKYSEPQIIAICILKGSLFFAADILRYCKLSFMIDFVKLSSYGKDIKSSGTVTILKDISTNVEGKDIIIFDEIVDSGRTLDFYIKRLEAAKPKSIKVCALIDKKIKRHKSININVDYIGIEAQDEFLVGYGLDYAEQFRNNPDIYELHFKDA